MVTNKGVTFFTSWCRHISVSEIAWQYTTPSLNLGGLCLWFIMFIGIIKHSYCETYENRKINKHSSFFHFKRL